MDSFILLRIFNFLPISEFLSLSLTCHTFNECVLEIINKDTQFSTIHHFHKLQNHLSHLSTLTSQQRLYHSTLKKCNKLMGRSKEEWKKLKKTLYLQGKYNKHFYNKENDLIFTLENHQLSTLYPKWRCITHLIELHFHEQTDKSWKMSFDFGDEESRLDSLLLRFFEFELDGFANVDNIGENVEILANPKYLDKAKNLYATRGAKLYLCNLFIWFKPKRSMPPNDTKFTAIVQKRLTSYLKKVQDYQVINDYLYRIDVDGVTKLFHRKEWKEKWNPMCPVHDVHYFDE